MNITAGQELTSNFFVILTDPNGVQGLPQMPAGGPFITDIGYQVMVNGVQMTGQQIRDVLTFWLTHQFPK